MSESRNGRRALTELLTSSAFAAAFTVATVGALFGGHLLVRLMGVVGYSSAIVGLVAIAVAILVARRAELSLLRFMPVSLALFMLWLLVTVAWSTSPPHTVTGWLAIAAPTVLGIAVAHIRDTIQIVRAVGDVLRALLVASLAIEIFSGILIDTPLRFLGIAGNLAEGGPIQGVFGTRTRLGVVTVIALVTFLVEWRTRSVSRGTAIFSIVVGAALAAFTASPIVLVLAAISTVAMLLLALVRRTPPGRRSELQWAILVSLVIGAVIVYVFRHPLVAWLNAEPDFFRRSQLWNTTMDMVELRPVHGWGWFGEWSGTHLPFLIIDIRTGESNESALNAYLDVLLQSGSAGLALFAVFGGLALMRAWITASQRRSTTYVWPALILITLAANAMVESGLLNGFSWFLLVVCAARSSVVGGWRASVTPADPVSGLPPSDPLGGTPGRLG